MTILQKSFMLRTPDQMVEKVSIQDKFVDCAPYLSKSGATFNGCIQAKHGNLSMVRGLYKLYGEPLYKFISRGKITRDIDVMKNLVEKFLQQFNLDDVLVYFDNYAVHIYDAYRKAVMLEDTPQFVQGHLFIYRLNTQIDFSDAVKVTEEKAFNHKLIFTNSVSVLYDTLDDIHISPGYGFIVQKADDDPVRISSPDHGETIAELSEGLWLFIHSPPTQKVD
jgi:hypothetical protein